MGDGGRLWNLNCFPQILIRQNFGYQILFWIFARLILLVDMEKLLTCNVSIACCSSNCTIFARLRRFNSLMTLSYKILNYLGLRPNTIQYTYNADQFLNLKLSCCRTFRLGSEFCEFGFWWKVLLVVKCCKLWVGWQLKVAFHGSIGGQNLRYAAQLFQLVWNS